MAESPESQPVERQTGNYLTPQEFKRRHRLVLRSALGVVAVSLFGAYGVGRAIVNEGRNNINAAQTNLSNDLDAALSQADEISKQANDLKESCGKIEPYLDDVGQIAEAFSERGVPASPESAGIPSTTVQASSN